MFTRAASLRFWLLLAMIGSALIGLGAAVLLFNHVESTHERAADAAKARQEARSVATQVEAGADAARLAALQDLLANDQITVERGGRIVFQGPPLTGRDLELRVRAAFPGGVVRIADYTSPGSSTTLDLTLITAGVLALVIAAAILTATLVTRSVRRPVERAIDAAEQVSRGDFSARVGTSGPDELVKLGSAFDDMAARLERADRDQRQFLADVAHEIATPINAISGFALALADGATREQHQREEARSLIEYETERLGNLLRDLRALTHLDLAEQVRVAPIELASFAEQLVMSFRPAASAAGVDLRFSAGEGQVLTDPHLLEMIASNLVSNGIRYTPAGGEVVVELAREGEELVLTVRDNGVGIAPKDQKRIFDRLYRVDSTRDRATGGSGLGLAIVRRAVQNLGGRIELESALGRGTELRVVVPAGVASTTVETAS